MAHKCPLRKQTIPNQWKDRSDVNNAILGGITPVRDTGADSKKNF
jgi:hypothetical protein